MGKGRDKRRRKAKQLGQRTKEEEEVVRAIEAEVAQRMRKRGGSRPRIDPALGEPDALVSAPLKPRPNRRSGAIAMPEPEPENEFILLKPRAF